MVVGLESQQQCCHTPGRDLASVSSAPSVSHEAPCTGGVAGDEGTLGGAGERQHRRGGQAGSHDMGAASRAGFAAGKGQSPALCGFTSALLVLCVGSHLGSGHCSTQGAADGITAVEA